MLSVENTCSRASTLIEFQAVEELAGESSNFIGKVAFKRTGKSLQVLFARVLLSLPLFFRMTTGAVANLLFMAIGAEVVNIAVGALAWRIGLNTILANADLACRTLLQDASAALTLITNGSRAWAEERLTSNPFRCVLGGLEVN